MDFQAHNPGPWGAKRLSGTTFCLLSFIKDPERTAGPWGGMYDGQLPGCRNAGYASPPRHAFNFQGAAWGPVGTDTVLVIDLLYSSHIRKGSLHLDGSG